MTIEDKSLNDLEDDLSVPFPAQLIELRPGATNKEKTKALALPYVDPRDYQARLDSIVGVGNWSVSYEPWGADRVFCHLTILGVTKSDVGECADKDPNAATIAVAQAFKRACAAFGLGRYLYSLPQIWGEFDGKRITNADYVIQQMYQRAGLLKSEQQTAQIKPQVDKGVAQAEPATVGEIGADERGRTIATKGTIERDDDRYVVTVPGEDGKQETNRVWRDDKGRVVCSCSEFKKASAKNQDYRCEHIFAVKHYVATQKGETRQAQSA